MAMIVFLRGVNAGPGTRFRTAVFAKELSAFDVVNVGAAGTFIVYKKVSRAVLRTEMLRRLPFKTEVMICQASDLMDLVSSDPFPRGIPVKGVRRFLSVLTRRPSTMPRIPFSHPVGKPWQVKIVGMRGNFAVSVWRRTEKTSMYPTEFLERELAIPATSRNWETVVRICDILRENRCERCST
jgi:uncharacterized protein (DUF1697 family)